MNILETSKKRLNIETAVPMVIGLSVLEHSINGKFYPILPRRHREE
jgi:hypothetical protein